MFIIEPPQSTFAFVIGIRSFKYRVFWRCLAGACIQTGSKLLLYSAAVANHADVLITKNDISSFRGLLCKSRGTEIILVVVVSIGIFCW